MINERQLCLSTLLKVENDGAYSNIVLLSALNNTDFTNEQKSFFSRLFYGVIEKKLLLDFNINAITGYKKIDDDVKCILRMGMYQLIFMDNVPDNAAVNESVKLCDFVHKKSAKGFVNAVLRAKTREQNKTLLPDKSDKNYLSVKYSVDKSIVKCFVDQYGENAAEEILNGFSEQKSTFLRINTKLTTTEKLIDMLLKKGYNVKQNAFLPDCVEVKNLGSLLSEDEFKNGLFFVQDMSCQMACSALSIEENDRILDVCAAPGGKSFTASMYLENGEVISCDVSENRVSLIKNNAARLKIKNVTPIVNDATAFNEKLGLFDKIICDVPCSGLGVISKKPEIRYKKTDVNELFDLQLKILTTSSRYLKSGGLLVYSTCTLNERENEAVAEAFLSGNDEFEKAELSFADGRYCKTFFPQKDNCDGFFVSVIRRK